MCDPWSCMVILLVIKVNILVLVKWSYEFPPLVMLTIEPKID